MNIFDFNRVLNLYVGSSQLACKMNNRDRTVILQSLQALAETSDVDKITESLDNILVKAEKRFKFQAVNIILADPMLMQINLDLPTLPKNKQRLHQLILLKIEKDYQLDKNKYTFSVHHTKTRDSINRFIVYVVGNDLLNGIKRSVDRQNKFLRMVTPSYQIIHNSAQQPQKLGNHVLFYLDKESWTLSILDKDNDIRFLRSKWHENNIIEILDSLSVIFRSLSNIGIRTDFKSAAFIGDEHNSHAVSEYLNSIVGVTPINLSEKSGLTKKVQATHVDLIYSPLMAYK